MYVCMYVCIYIHICSEYKYICVYQIYSICNMLNMYISIDNSLAVTNQVVHFYKTTVEIGQLTFIC